MKTRIVAIHDGPTRTTHYLERPAPTSPVAPAFDDYVGQLKRDRARLVEDLAGPCANALWRQDREEALRWTERELARLVGAA